MIAVEALTFVYPDGTRALDGVDLHIGRAESVAIVGQNGSGKSTLVRHLNGLLRPTSGRVAIDGEDIRDRHVAELARTVGLVFQDPDRQIFSRSVRAEVAFGARNAGLKGAAAETVVASALADVGLAGEQDTNPYDLGGSRRKLLALASVLAMRTPILVLDEPTTGQDARGVALVERLVRGLREQGRTIVAISHDMRFVAETFDRVVVMRDGRVVLDDTPKTVFAARSWAVLESARLEPPYAARAGDALGLGATPRDGDVVDALLARRR